ncbi:DUF2142 domain-containing protein [Jatrophihabitans telluris]|uniref:DUF2142 domain-containing protein n=1 Tax=Jatrophihabitans telluris TaxID=2038343 RepID=A0ABY4R063_9ACTN|nr:DUF2142 domain-containing protein [Jatrophihabitans telluris]UQX88449.1 DUF2142 domain-containing protein [Jatrophihabitans telluris]
MRRLRVWALPVAVALFYVAYLLCWSVTNPPFASPDEGAHYLRAIGVAQGHLRDTPKPYLTVRQAHVSSETMLHWLNQATTVVSVPRGMVTSGWTCEIHGLAHAASCLASARPSGSVQLLRTPVGNYQPMPYLAPALAMSHVHTAFAALLSARLVAAATCAVFLVLTVALSWTGEAWSLVGPSAAVTPMVLFTSASLNPSGLEIATALAWPAGLLALARFGHPPAWMWWASGAAGVALALSRTPGPVWVVLDLAVVAALTTGRGSHSFARDNRAAIAVTASAVFGAVVLNRVWEARYGSHLGATSAAIVRHLPGQAHVLPSLAEQLVGRFGWLDVGLPHVLVDTWQWGVVALVVIALSVASGRQRLVLTATILLVLAVTVTLASALITGTGYAVQGRHILPIAVLIPLVAGELARRNLGRLPTMMRMTIPAVVTVGALALNLLAWYGNARRYAVGIHGSLLFVLHEKWQPPLGWYPWLAIVVVATLAASAAAALGVVTGFVQAGPGDQLVKTAG